MATLANSPNFLQSPVYDHVIPSWVRALGVRWADGTNSYRMKWGELSTRNRLSFAFKLCLFGDELRYSLNVAFFWVSAFISLPFLRRWAREPHSIMESWGFSYSGESGLHVTWGSRYKIVEMPWRNWEQTSHEVMRPDGSWVPFVGSWEEGPLRVVNDKGSTLGGKEPDGRHTETHDYNYMLKSGEVQKRTATVYAERRIRRLKWLRWTSLFQRITYAIDVTFSDEVGERTGSWKGGCTGCGYELKPDETIRECLKRMESERRF